MYNRCLAFHELDRALADLHLSHVPTVIRVMLARRSAATAPSAMVVNGRRLSWEEFGAALEPFEGWTFRLEMRDIDTAQ